MPRSRTRKVHRIEQSIWLFPRFEKHASPVILIRPQPISPNALNSLHHFDHFSPFLQILGTLNAKKEILLHSICSFTCCQSCVDLPPWTDPYNPFYKWLLTLPLIFPQHVIVATAFPFDPLRAHKISPSALHSEIVAAGLTPLEEVVAVIATATNLRSIRLSVVSWPRWNKAIAVIHYFK